MVVQVIAGMPSTFHGAASAFMVRHPRSWCGIRVHGAASAFMVRHPRSWCGIRVHGAASASIAAS
jgi:hypothetical protein